jgi:hypothetical protein
MTAAAEPTPIVRPTLNYADAGDETGDRLVVWPSVNGELPVIQIDEGMEDGTSLAVAFRPEDAPQLAAAILTAADTHR